MPHLRIALKILGILLILFSGTLLLPLGVSWLYDDGVLVVFKNTFLVTFTVGFLLWLPFVRDRTEMHIKDGFLVTFLFYLALGLVGALPFIQVTHVEIPVTDAIFESFSGLTTTGATVLTGLDQLPPSLLFYRQQLQWLGGMGIIVLAVAILPMLGIGGMQLYRAETPGPVKDSKLTPRIKQTAIALWSIYIGLTAACALGYWSAGLIAIVFMVLSGINFGLHFFALNDRSVAHYFKDDEVLFYLSILGLSILLVTMVLTAQSDRAIVEAFRASIFQVVSVFTTTGFVTEDFSKWPSLLPYVIFFGAFTGACAGSTGGGIKAMRVLLICKQGLRETYRLIHPNAIFPIKLNKRPVPNRIVEAIWGYFAIYVIAFLFMHLAMIACGLDFTSAFSAVGASINNLGPGLGDVAAHYGHINDPAKLILCFAMILGRLEIFTLLVLFTPMFWRR